MRYFLDTIDIYLGTILFWSMMAYFLAPILLNKLKPIPRNVPTNERRREHWAVFFLKWGNAISITLSVLYVFAYIFAFQQLIPSNYEFINLQWELKNTFIKYGAFLIPVIFIENQYYFSELQIPGVNYDESNT
ncbi:MAG: hypothetical protein OEY52_09280 [Gammaproteobacteria bacterium]|nr:hypothetical protein [Gammaproteobacteria bacterium]